MGKGIFCAFLTLVITGCGAAGVGIGGNGASPLAFNLKKPDKKQLAQAAARKLACTLLTADNPYLAKGKFTKVDRKGWPRAELNRALCIVNYESGFNAKAKSGGTVGLFQIDPLHLNPTGACEGMGKATQLSDPFFNSACALNLYLYRVFVRSGKKDQIGKAAAAVVYAAATEEVRSGSWAPWSTQGLCPSPSMGLVDQNIKC